MLGLIQGAVGFPQQGFRGGFAGYRKGNANADRQPALLIRLWLEHHGRDGIAEPLRRGLGFHRGTAGHDHCELLPAIAGERIEDPGVLAQRIRDRAQRAVAHFVAVFVVHRLEMIDIDHQH